MLTSAIVRKSGSEASSGVRSDHALGFKAGASVTSTEARAERSKSAICFGASIGLIASAAPAASPPQMVKWVSGKIGQHERRGTIGRNAERGENVRGARHLVDEFGVVPNVRVVEAVKFLLSTAEQDSARKPSPICTRDP